MQSQEIEHYLAELGAAITEPRHQQARSPAPDRRRLHDASCQRTTDH